MKNKFDRNEPTTSESQAFDMGQVHLEWYVVSNRRMKSKKLLVWIDKKRIIVPMLTLELYITSKKGCKL